MRESQFTPWFDTSKGSGCLPAAEIEACDTGSRLGQILGLQESSNSESIYSSNNNGRGLLLSHYLLLRYFYLRIIKDLISENSEVLSLTWYIPAGTAFPLASARFHNTL